METEGLGSSGGEDAGGSISDKLYKVKPSKPGSMVTFNQLLTVRFMNHWGK